MPPEHAFAAKTGKLFWTVKLGAAGQVTLTICLGKKGKSYVAISSAGGFLQSPLTGGVTAFTSN